MQIATGWSHDPETSAATRAAWEMLRSQLAAEPSLLIAYPSATHATEQIIAVLREVAPDTPLHGGTSCRGAMTEAGFHSADGTGLVLWGICDPQGAYGVGMAAIPDHGAAGDARQAGREAISRAIVASGRPGEMPPLIWLTGVPGYEEEVLQGIQDVVGPRVPIAGGSAADNEVAGQWHQFTRQGSHNQAVVVTAVYPSTAIHFAFHSGYSPTARRGTVTRAEGRTLYEIDGQPAAHVYNGWTGGAVTPFLEGGNVLGATSLYPLGRQVLQPGGRLAYRLAHPEAIVSDGAMTLFAEMEEGDELLLMAGTRESLTSRAGRVARLALDAGRVAPEEVAGALVVYCAGCMLTVESEMDKVVESVRTMLPETPFAGTFTFGEQGCFVSGDSYHGNLMISVVVFTKSAD